MRLGIVGAGVMGGHHARVVRRLGHDVVAVADQDPALAQVLASGVGAEAVGDWRGAAAAGAEALIVATPTVTHADVAVGALAAGLHVLVEKPLAVTEAEARRVVDAAAAAGCVLAVGHVERHNPVTCYVREALHSDAVGAPVTVSMRRVSNLPGRIRDVGCIMDLGIHDLDILNQLAGGLPVEVYAVGGTRTSGLAHEDHATILARYPAMDGVVEVNWLTQRKVRQLTATCERAYLEGDLMGQSLRISTSRWDGRAWDTVSDDAPIQREEPLVREVRDFVAAIEEGRRPLADGTAGLEAVAVAQAALRSLSSGVPERPLLAPAGGGAV